LLAVDPAAPEGDRVVGYQLVREGVDSAVVEQFLTRLAAAGIQPDEVITDGATLYPRVLTDVWPQAAHQLCLFHETRRLTTAAQEVIRQVRRTLPTPPPAATYGWGGPLRAQPPSDNPADPAVQRWQARQDARRAGIAQVQALAHQGLSLRAIARQRGLHRRTVRAWLRPAPPPVSDLHSVEPAASTPTRAYHRRTPALVAQIHQLSAQGLSYIEIARQTGVHRVSVSARLREQGQEGEHPLPEPVAAADTLPAPRQDAPQADIPLRSVASIEGALKVRAYRRKETADTLPPPVALCRRGRRLDGRIEDCVAA